jgi:hydrogenase maturation protein HypF
MMQTQMPSAIPQHQRTIRVRGTVQGVGFRPTVWRYATELGLSGEVYNDGDGVLIICQGSQSTIDTLISRIQQSPPPQAQISSIENWYSDKILSSKEFIIAASHYSIAANTGVSPDLATCPDCLTDMKHLKDRRHNYAFTNCTHCGPRLSIVRALPYDRHNTSMEKFAQCSSCQAEYENPADRRFHAQPNACPTCGPALWLSSADGQSITKQPIAQAQSLIRAGKIVAIKGLGGFHLAVDANNPKAVERLRLRKQRPHKPFALMAQTTEQIENYCELDRQERQLLQSAAAPIVLLTQKTTAKLPANINPDQTRLGFMLPMSPLHYLLMEGFDGPLVMTSGNASGQPQCINNKQALASLGQIADAFLLHNRDIVNRVDDSVVQVNKQQQQLLRRARGYAPQPLPLPPGFETAPSVLALGGELKNTFCLLHGNQAILSQHIGDLKDMATYTDFEHTLKLYQQMFKFQADVIAIDQHPHYLSSEYGRSLATLHSQKLIEVQHHHAHIAACLADNLRPLQAQPVLGLCLDGMGFARTDNENDTIWGGEILLANYHSATRLARIRPTAMPGGNLAMQQPWRNCLAQLDNAIGWPTVVEKYGHLPLIKTLQQQPLDTILAMINRGVNTPFSSSCGRLFDAIAAAVGINIEGSLSFEGQAAMTLEASIDNKQWSTATPYSLALNQHDELLEIDPAPLWPELLDDLDQGQAAGLIASRFHLGLAEALSKAVVLLAEKLNLDTVALSGGVMQNLRLSQALEQRLRARGLHVLQHQQVPANDGGIALGQALIAAANTLKNN